MMTTTFFGNDVCDALYDCERGSEPNAHAFYPLWTARMSVDVVDGYEIHRFALTPSPFPTSVGEGSSAPL